MPSKEKILFQVSFEDKGYVFWEHSELAIKGLVSIIKYNLTQQEIEEYFEDLPPELKNKDRTIRLYARYFRVCYSFTYETFCALKERLYRKTFD